MLGDNYLLSSALLAGITAQVVKIPVTYLRKNYWDWKVAFQPSGMPSSHTAMMIGLTCACLFQYGVSSPYFAISFIFSLIVMYDAAGVRRHAGQQAAVINELTLNFRDLISQFKESEISVKNHQLKEALGHKPVEVLGGICVGAFIAFLLK